MRSFALCGLLAIAGMANAQTVVYDTFNEGDQANLFDCCTTWPVSTQHSGAGQWQAAAIPFTPPTDGSVIQFDLALSWYSGSPANLVVSIHSDQNGLPGKLRGGKPLAGTIPPGGQCCEFVTARESKDILHGGLQYWVVVSASGMGDGGWNFNTLGQVGALATYAPGTKTWTLTQGTLPAVRLYMK